MIDYTFDIANEYLKKMKLSHKDIVELNETYKKDEADRQERFEKRKNLSSKQIQEMDGIRPATESASASDQIIHPMESYAEHIAKQPKAIQRIHKMSDRYCGDKRLCYSNNHYYQMVFAIALHELIERTLSDGPTSYEIARNIVEENKELIEKGGFETHGNTIYPKAPLDEFEKRVLALKKDFIWHRDDECGLFDTFAIAFHYGQEIPQEYIQVRMSRFERFIRGKNFVYFVYVPYCIIPYLIQEAIVAIISVVNLINNGVPTHETIRGFRQVVDRSYVLFITTMMFIATIFWMCVFK